MSYNNNYNYDWRKIPAGSTFTCEIMGIKTSGRIQKYSEDAIFLCQNEKKGISINNKLGYKFSWGILSGNLDNLRTNVITNLRVWLPEKGFKVPKESVLEKLAGMVNHNVEIDDTKLIVGCKKIPFKIVHELSEYLKIIEKKPK
jgi:hypothetical protein